MAIAFDPESLPVLGADSQLPAVPPSHLTPEAIRSRFAAPPAWRPDAVLERRIGDREPARASVLIGIVAHHVPTVLLTLRTAHLTDHPGQISFPGGRAEAFDVDAIATALRETAEEIGLDASWIEVLGSLPIYTTGTGFVVTPVVALVQPGFTPAADPFEVAEVFEVPLHWLMDPAHHQRHAVEIGGVQREFLSMPWPGIDGDGRPRRYFIWGATAAMLRNLYRFFAA